MGKQTSIYTYTGKLGEGIGYKNHMGYQNRKYVANISNPRTKRQLLTRARFATIGRLAGIFEPALIGFAKVAYDSKKYATNIFVKRNWDHVTAVTPDEVTVNYSTLQIADGILPQINYHTPDFETEASVSVTWDIPSGAYGMSTDDKVFLFVYQPDTQQKVLSEPQRLSERSITVDVPALWSGMRVHLWAFTLRGNIDNTNTNVRELLASARDCDCSPSTYVGTGDIA